MRMFGRRQGGVSGVLLITRSPNDVFEGPSKGAARRVRDTSIPDTTPFDEDERLAIVMRFRGKEIWQVRRGGNWVDACVMAEDADE